MNLESASFVAQILGAVAVVLSLIYVGVQIRQSTKITRITAAQNLQVMFGRIEELIMTDAEFSELVLRGTRQETLSPMDSWRWTLMSRNVLRTWQTAHYMYRTGVLDKAIWEPQAVLLAGLLRDGRGLQARFREETASLDPVFVEYANKIIGNAAPFEAVPTTELERVPISKKSLPGAAAQRHAADAASRNEG